MAMGKFVVPPCRRVAFAEDELTGLVMHPHRTVRQETEMIRLEFAQERMLGDNAFEGLHSRGFVFGRY
jgi:hypothetical protein